MRRLIRDMEFFHIPFFINKKFYKQMHETEECERLIRMEKREEKEREEDDTKDEF